jgi:hypothetical protein
VNTIDNRPIVTLSAEELCKQPRRLASNECLPPVLAAFVQTVLEVKDNYGYKDTRSDEQKWNSIIENPHASLAASVFLYSDKCREDGFLWPLLYVYQDYLAPAIIEAKPITDREAFALEAVLIEFLSKHHGWRWFGSKEEWVLVHEGTDTIVYGSEPDFASALAFSMGGAK